MVDVQVGIEPTALRKKIADINDLIAKEVDDTDDLKAKESKAYGVASGSGKGSAKRAVLSLPRQELMALIESLTEQMQQAAVDLHFELAARLRDEIRDLKRELREMEAGEA